MLEDLMVEIMEVAASSITAITTTDTLADAEAHYNLAESYYLKLLSFQN